MQNIRNSKEKIIQLQALRGIAFIGILLTHTNICDCGALFVSVFIILSGFLEYYHYYDIDIDCKFKNCLNFSIKKIKKLYPLHILTMCFSIVLKVIDLIKDFSLRVVFTTIAKVIINVLLLQSLFPLKTIYFSLNGVAWYLSLSTFLYLLFPLIKKLIIRLNKYNTVCIMLIVFLIQFLSSYLSSKIIFPFSDNFMRWFNYIFPLYRAFDFFNGCLLGKIYIDHRNDKKDSHRFLFSLLEVLLVFLIIVAQYIFTYKITYLGQEFMRYSVLFSPISILVVYLFIKNEGIVTKMLSNKWLIWLGNISSYCYLIHQILLSYIEIVVNTYCDFILHKWHLFFSSLIITILLSIIFKRIFEKSKNHKYI